MQVEARVEENIQRPIKQVFAAIVDPAKLSGYFTTGASGPLKAGTTVVWEFADVGARVPVDVIEVEADRRIVYESTVTGPRTRVTMALTETDVNTTRVTISEAGWPMDVQGVKRALGQTAGWTYFLCCLKAYMQHGINLRLGLTKRLTAQ